MPKPYIFRLREVLPKKDSPHWHTRGYAPHFEDQGTTQHLIFRLFDSLPQTVLQGWETELQSWPKADADIERRKRVENYLDAGYGCCLMKDERIADLVQNALLHFENERYALHAWCVMPNHVHALITPLPNFSVGSITQSWKSFIAHEANKLLKRRGPFWQPDVYDRFIRNEQHFQNAVKYIENNPVQAGLCESPNNWTWSSANRP